MVVTKKNINIFGRLPDQFIKKFSLEKKDENDQWMNEWMIESQTGRKTEQQQQCFQQSFKFMVKKKM